MFFKQSKRIFFSNKLRKYKGLLIIKTEIVKKQLTAPKYFQLNEKLFGT